MRVLWTLGALCGAVIACMAAVKLSQGNAGAWVSLLVGVAGLVFFGIGWVREAPLFGRRTSRDRTTRKAADDA